jgi:hypothetical protein
MFEGHKVRDLITMQLAVGITFLLHIIGVDPPCIFQIYNMVLYWIVYKETMCGTTY